MIYSNNVKTQKTEAYDIDEIFKKRKQEKTNTAIENQAIKEETSMVEYKEEGLFKKIINKILSLFNK